MSATRLEIVLKPTNALKLRGVLAGCATSDGALFLANLRAGHGLARATGTKVELAGKVPELRHAGGVAVRGDEWYVAGFAGVFQSTNGGKAWKRLRDDADGNMRGVGVDGSGRIWATYDDGTVAWSDDGARWTELSARGLAGARVAIVDGRAYFLGKGTIATTVNGKLVTTKAGIEPIVALAATADGVLVAGSEDQYLYRGKLTGGGLPELVRSARKLERPAEAMASHDGGVVIGAGEHVLRTQDGSSTTQLAALPSRTFVRSLVATPAGLWIGAETLPSYEGTLAWIPGGKPVGKTATARATPSVEATPGVPPPAAKPSPRRNAAALDLKERRDLVAVDAYKELGLGKTLQMKAADFGTAQRIRVFDGHLRADRLTTPGTDAAPYSIVVRGDLDLDGLELASDGPKLFLMVTGELRARYAWLCGNVHLHVGKGVRLAEMLVASEGDDDGWIDIKGGLSAQAIVVNPGFQVQLTGKRDALAIGNDDEIDKPAYAPDDASQLFDPSVLDEDEWSPQKMLARLRASKPVFRAQIPSPN